MAADAPLATNEHSNDDIPMDRDGEIPLEAYADTMTPDTDDNDDIGLYTQSQPDLDNHDNVPVDTLNDGLANETIGSSNDDMAENADVQQRTSDEVDWDVAYKESLEREIVTKEYPIELDNPYLKEISNKSWDELSHEAVTFIVELNDEQKAFIRRGVPAEFNMDPVGINSSIEVIDDALSDMSFSDFAKEADSRTKNFVKSLPENLVPESTRQSLLNESLPAIDEMPTIEEETIPLSRRM